jgi:hypothetical protein
MRIVLGLLLVVGLALRARAQTVYVDFEPVGSSAGTAPATYGGSAQAPGVWNAVSGSSSVGLLTSAGLPSGVTLNVLAPASSTYFEVHDFSTPPDEALLDDCVRADWNACELAFSGLAAGEYSVDTIVVQSGNIFATQVSVPGSPDPDLYLTGSWNGSYVPGTTGFGGAGNYARQRKTVSDGSLSVFVYVSGFTDQILVEGLQLVRLGPAITSMCAGDGTLAACPCGNSGASGRGCENSAATGGGVLAFGGDTAPDSLVLQASGLLPNASAIFLQGSANIAPLPFGDGMRCAGGTLKRLYLKSASAGAASAPQAGDPPVTLRSAALGDPIPPGDRRYYQVYYRDPNPAFCPAPTGATWNITNSLRVYW